MNILVLSLALLICGCCGENPHHDLTYVIQHVINDTDVNPHDGIISADELKQELIGKWSPSGVSKQDFLHEWTSRYIDNQKDAATFFDNLDIIKDGVLTEFDLLLHMPSMEKNSNGEVSVAELDAFIRKMHP